MVTTFAEKFDLALAATYMLSPGDLDRFAVDKGINHLLSGLLKIIPESFPGDSHHVSSLVLLDMKEIAKTDSLKLFNGQVDNFEIAERNFPGLKVCGFRKARYPALNSIDHQITHM